MGCPNPCGLGSLSLVLAAISGFLVSSVSGQCASNVTFFNNTDFNSTIRVPGYPNGLPSPSFADCCAVCTATPGCAAWVQEVNEKTCFPLQSYIGTHPGGDRILGLMPPPPPPPPPPASWLPRIAANDMLYAPSDVDVPGSLMPMVGNGFVATQVGSDSVWVSGIFNGYLTSSPSHRARVPAVNAVAAPGFPAAAALDMREAVYYRRSYLDPSPPGACTAASAKSCSNAPARLWIEQRWYAHRALPSLLVMEVQLLPSYDGGFDGGDGAGWEEGGANSSAATAAAADVPYAMLLLANAAGGSSGDLNLSSVAVPADAPYTAVAGSTLVSETNTSGLQTVAILSTSFPAGGAPLAVPSSAPFATAAFLTVVRTSIETAGGVPALVAAAQADYATALALAANGTLLSSHVAEWAETIWPSGFETDRGDLARAVNGSLYAILSSVRNDREYGLSPGGLTDGYHGHSFWDCESWMFGPVNALLPDVGASLLQYRVNRLDGAREKAGTYDPPFSGAMFPWESALTGVETCPTWAATGLREIHISGDIACAVWQFWRATQDNSGGWLNNTGWPLLSGIADFWMSKLAIDNPSYGPTGPLNLDNVIPPDEYADHVNNSAYTNAVAILSLQYASAVAALLGEPPASYAPWLDAAGRIVVPYESTTPSGGAGGWHPEYAGYTNGTTIKQADTILLGFPLEVAFGNSTPASRANDLNYYATVTDPGGPAMTWGMFSVGYVQLGPAYASLAASNFNRSFANMQPPFLTWTETPTGGTPNFVTGAGGFLQAALFGYTGLRVNDTAFVLAPELPEGSSSVKLRAFSYLGNRLDISYDSGGSLTILIEAPPTAEEVDAGPGVHATRRRYAHACRSAAAGGQCAAHVESLLGAVEGARTRALLVDNAQRPLSTRSQRGRVVLGGGRHVVAAQPLVLVDADGAEHPLLPGTPLVLPTQTIAILAKA